MRLKLHLVPVLGLIYLSASIASPVSPDDVETTPQPQAEISADDVEAVFDQAGEITTEPPQSNEVLRDFDDNVFSKFKYPLEPEERYVDERPLEDALPADFDMSQTNLSVVAVENPHAEILSGRAHSCQCGRPGDRNIPLRIVNGTVVRINDYPWTVALVRRQWFGEASGAFCGGTLINSRYILTASHCVDGMSPNRFEIRVHEEDFASNSEVEGGTQRIGVEKIIMHPYYNRKTIDNDIALVKLAQEVTLDNVVVPSCLPANNDYTFEGIEGTAAGWGATAEGSSVSSTLMKVNVPIIANADCNSDKTNYAGKITDNMMCAGDVDKGGVDSCQGDSGGPLTIENGGRRTLVGVVSWGYGCARPKSPGVYTRVGRYSQWIVANSKGASWCTA